jgi:hypothetical protein
MGLITTYIMQVHLEGSIITQFHNRLWVTGAAVPNGNQLYGFKPIMPPPLQPTGPPA